MRKLPTRMPVLVMLIDFPVEIGFKRFGEHRCRMGLVHRSVVFKAILAQVPH